MSRLKVLYFNVDTLYPNIWVAECERELLSPLVELRHLPEMHVIVRWVRPLYKNPNPDWFEDETGKKLIRWNSLEIPDDLFKASPEANMRRWIIEKVGALERDEL
jgi:hypothetical protein